LKEDKKKEQSLVKKWIDWLKFWNSSNI
jgi:hypothetical protein